MNLGINPWQLSSTSEAHGAPPNLDVWCETYAGSLGVQANGAHTWAKTNRMTKQSATAPGFCPDEEVGGIMGCDKERSRNVVKPDFLQGGKNGFDHGQSAGNTGRATHLSRSKCASDGAVSGLTGSGADGT